MNIYSKIYSGPQFGYLLMNRLQQLAFDKGPIKRITHKCIAKIFYTFDKLCALFFKKFGSGEMMLGRGEKQFIFWPNVNQFLYFIPANFFTFTFLLKNKLKNHFNNRPRRVFAVL